ncbi:hypothetical protein M8J75_004706 [Diaphorina citri]|nr:hypothetical protein M8J75_004706 [Diaphorina citri]
MLTSLSVQSVSCCLCFISIETIADSIKSEKHRSHRSLGDMNQFGGPGGIQGVNNFGANDGVKNPDSPQMESIYRGKVFWGGNGTDGKQNDQWVYEKGRYADIETDKFGNPIHPPRRGPRPQIKPQRKEDVHEAGIGKRSVQDPSAFKVKLDKNHFTSEQVRKYDEIHDRHDEVMDLIDDNIDESISTVIQKAKERNLVKKRSVDQRKLGDFLSKNVGQMPVGNGGSKLHSIQKRSIENRPPGPDIECIYKGPGIKSQYKGPVIRSQYNGLQIRSQYLGPQIRAQYMGPQMLSEYKGKMISMLGGVDRYEQMLKEAQCNTQSKEVINLAQKYDKMNQEYKEANYRLMRHVRGKPKLAAIFQNS